MVMGAVGVARGPQPQGDQDHPQAVMERLKLEDIQDLLGRDRTRDRRRQLPESPCRHIQDHTCHQQPVESVRQPHQRRGTLLLAVVDGLIVADVILDPDDLFPTIQWHGSMHPTLLITQFITEWSFGFYK